MARLDFHFAIDGDLPPGQQISVTSQAALDWAVTCGAAWLQCSPAAGETPGTINVAVNVTGLEVGDHDGTVVISSDTARNRPIQVPVGLAIEDLHLLAEPTTFTFDAVVGGPQPAAQELQLQSASEVDWRVSCAEPWLGCEPASGQTPGSVRVSVDPTALVAGTYGATILVDSDTASNVTPPIEVGVRLEIPEPRCGDGPCNGAESCALCRSDCCGERETAACRIAPGTVSIDGAADEWSDVQAFPLSSELNDPSHADPTSDADVSGWFKTMWDGESLYVLVEVRDDALVADSSGFHLDDGIELCVDGGREATAGAYDRNDAQIKIRYDHCGSGCQAGCQPDCTTTSCASQSFCDIKCANACSGTELTNCQQGCAAEIRVGDLKGDPPPATLFFESETALVPEPNADGLAYRVEVAVPFRLLNADPTDENTPRDPVLTAGDVIGFGVAINDDDDGDGRDHYIVWTDPDGWSDASVLGTLTLEGVSCP